MGKRVFFGDIETRSADDMWDFGPRQMFRLGQYAWGWDGDIILTEDYDEYMRQLTQADIVVFHNGHAFDLSVLFGKDSITPLLMALDGKIIDTMVHAAVVMPAPSFYVNRAGTKVTDAASPERAHQWLSLDNLCFQLGLPGKFGDLKAMAKHFGGFEKIPLDDPDFRAYAIEDIVALRALTRRLFELAPFDDYAWREQIDAAINAQNSRNGVLVDVEQAHRRNAELAVVRKKNLDMLVDKYDFPTIGKAPWKSNLGKAAITAALADFGVSLDDLPRTKDTKTKKPTIRPSFGGKGIVEACEDKSIEAQEFAQALAELLGLRTLSQLALDCMRSDGRVHPSITAFQRSARKSTTKPGMTVITSHGPGAVEKKTYCAKPGYKIVEFDYQAADTRGVAGYSGDTEFLKLTDKDADPHEITARLIFGDSVYDRSLHRQRAKPVTHASAYNAGAETLARTAKLPVADMETFLRNRKRKYPKLYRWNERVIEEGRRGFITTAWGRKLKVDPRKSFTQSPAQYGQNCTREIVTDALIRMARKDVRLIQWLIIQVHDALAFEIPEEHLVWAVPMIKDCMETWFDPPGGQRVHFPVEHGKPSDNWYDAGH